MLGNIHEIVWTGAEKAMALCKHHQICGRDANPNTEDGLCILHSPNPEKDKTAFDNALTEHCNPDGPNKANKDNFSFFVFPGDADFRGATFKDIAAFENATFTGNGHFESAIFEKLCGLQPCHIYRRC